MKHIDKSLPKDGSLVLSGIKLKALRKATGLSQENVANQCAEMRVQISIASLKRAECGRSISYRTARLLAQFYEVSIEDILLNDTGEDGDLDSLAKRAIPSQIISDKWEQNNKSLLSTEDFVSKILIVDDHATFRKGLLYTIQGLGNKYNVFQASTLEEAMSLASLHTDIDLVLLDLNLPDARGLSGFYEMKKTFPVLPVALLSAVDEKSIMIEAIRNGAQGYIHKSIDSEALNNVLALILSGVIYVPEQIVTQGA